MISSVSIFSESMSEISGTKKVETVHPNAWGYRDTSFAMSDEGMFSLSGDRYLYSGKKFPSFYEFIQKFGVDKDIRTPPNVEMPPAPAAVFNEVFVSKIRQLLPQCKLVSDDANRILASHGHTVQECWELRFGKSWNRLVDAVIFPESHRDVENIVRLCVEHNVAIIPFGGGTTVSHSLIPTPGERRMILSVSVSSMNKILRIDRENLTVSVEAGCVGSHLEKALAAAKFTLGHEPDSWEFSTVGGWIATKASGMKKNMYGNIEDILIDLKFVTAIGTLSRHTEGIPRCSAGPDVLQMVMGSEGTLGIVTEAVLKIRPIPECKQFGSLVFPNFDAGLDFLRKVALLRLQPASIRLMDNMQFQLGSSLKPEQGWHLTVLDRIIKFYVLNIKGFKGEEICAVTMSFEGSKSQVSEQVKRMNQLGNEFKGMPAGAENGIRGYFLTFVIAYLRDFGLQYKFLAESFETSAPWSKVRAVIEETKKQVLADCKAAGVQFEPMISARVTQTYDSGAAIYFYLGISWKGLSDPVATYSLIEDRARECVMKNGGSISHHHGVGKIRKAFMNQAVGDVGKSMIRGIKNAVDPNNIFAANNLI